MDPETRRNTLSYGETSERWLAIVHRVVVVVRGLSRARRGGTGGEDYLLLRSTGTGKLNR